MINFERTEIDGHKRDESNFVLQRATDSSFTENLVTKEIAYTTLKWTKKDNYSATSSFTYTDKFSDVYGQGKKTFY